MQLWKSILAYDGTSFHGWQAQPGLSTVQGTLAQALHHITGETVLPQGSGRTDAGVHALAQVASFALAAPIPPSNLHRALNRALPPSIRILSVAHAPANFHARHSAIRKTYEYRLFPRVVVPAPDEPALPDRICPPFLAPCVWDYSFPFNLAAAAEAAAHVLGTHDFTSFAAADPDQTARTTRSLSSHYHSSSPLPLLSFRSEVEESASALSSQPSQSHKSAPHSPQPHRDEWESNHLPSSASALGPRPSASSNTRTIHYSTWTYDPTQNLYLYRVTGSGFLHHMVRNLVGAFTDAASGRIPPSAIPNILAARDRSAAGPTAPARGLFLVEVNYE